MPVTGAEEGHVRNRQSADFTFWQVHVQSDAAGLNVTDWTTMAGNVYSRRIKYSTAGGKYYKNDNGEAEDNRRVAAFTVAVEEKKGHQEKTTSYNKLAACVV